MLHEINIENILRNENTKLSRNLYNYGNDRLPMSVLKNLLEVIDFVNPRNENLRQNLRINSRVDSSREQSTGRFYVVSLLKRMIGLFMHPTVFRLLDAEWSPYTINRFASYCNFQLFRYNTRFSSPGSSGVDGFAQDWSNENNWLCPPVSLIVQTVRKLQSCNGFGTFSYLVFSYGLQVYFCLFCMRLHWLFARMLKASLFCLRFPIFV